MLAGKQMREELAATQHDIWAYWMGYLFGVCDENGDGSITIPERFVKRWKRQAVTHYAFLSEEEKESDRHQADKVLATLGGQMLSKMIVESFVDRVNTKAEANIAKTHKLEGSHYAAMQSILKEM